MGNFITKNHRLEWGIWVLFTVLLVGTMYVHEPWFDEAQAWLIARDASFKDILWLLPHYEGHPPFFHLLLAIPAKLGLGWEWGLRAIGALFSVASAYLIIFKAPFPRWVRLLLPFTYFLFYQYGVIVRPYNIMVFVMCLLAIYFPQKDKRPGLFVSLLAALCACHLFGITIAGGIAAAWLWEIKAGRPWKEYLTSLGNDKRFYWLLGLLGWALLLVWLIFPRSNTFVMLSTFQQGNFIHQLVYLIAILPADALLSNIYDIRLPLSALSFDSFTLVCGGLVGLSLWVTILYSLTKKFIPYLLFPYLFTVIPMSYYMSRHHQGIALLIFLFALWICWHSKSVVLSVFCKAVWIVILLVSVSQTALNCYFDFKYPAHTGKDFISFLNEHQLNDKRIFVKWLYMTPEDLANFPGFVKPEDREDTNFTPIGTELSFYTSRNLFANLNHGAPFTYITHIHPAPAENQANLSRWRAGGLPDVAVDKLELDHVFEQTNVHSRYALVSSLKSYDIWKFNKPTPRRIPIYVRRDLLEGRPLTEQDEMAFFLQVN